MPVTTPPAQLFYALVFRNLNSFASKFRICSQILRVSQNLPRGHADIPLGHLHRHRVLGLCADAPDVYAQLRGVQNRLPIFFEGGLCQEKAFFYRTKSRNTGFSHTEGAPRSLPWAMGGPALGKNVHPGRPFVLRSADLRRGQGKKVGQRNHTQEKKSHLPKTATLWP